MILIAEILIAPTNHRPSIITRAGVIILSELVTSAKLCDKYDGPYKLKRNLSLVVYILITEKGKYAGEEHTRHLEPHVPRRQVFSAHSEENFPNFDIRL